MHLLVSANNYNNLMFSWVHIRDDTLPHLNHFSVIHVRNMWQN